jgi:protein-tyrosine kinase
MTIIEAALQKTKALRGSRPEPQGAAAGTRLDAPAQARHVAEPAAVPATPPSTAIHAKRVAFDPERARENRVLLSSSIAQDRGIIASYGMLRTRILHRARSSSNGLHTVGLTSAAPQDGKSLTAVNLALSLAREKNSMVVLLDLDMRNPSVCRTLGITPQNELRDYFERRIETPEELFVSIGIDNLLIAGNVTATDSSAELLASSRLEELLAFIRESTTNPLILIDLPPVLSPEDTLVVAPRIDALVLVACEGKTPRADLQKAAELLADFPLIGLVLNRSSDIVQGYGYGYGYGQGRGDGPS